LLIRHSKYSAMLSKNTLQQTAFSAILPTGLLRKIAFHPKFLVIWYNLCEKTSYCTNLFSPCHRNENTAPRRNSRHSSTTSDGDDYHNKSATERRSKWESQASKDFSGEKSRIKALGGSTGACVCIFCYIILL